MELEAALPFEIARRGRFLAFSTIQLPRSPIRGLFEFLEFPDPPPPGSTVVRAIRVILSSGEVAVLEFELVTVVESFESDSVTES